MGKFEITVLGYQCNRCYHEWVPRNKLRAPDVCPKCKSTYWNKPRIYAARLNAAIRVQDNHPTEPDLKTGSGGEIA